MLERNPREQLVALRRVGERLEEVDLLDDACGHQPLDAAPHTLQPARRVADEDGPEELRVKLFDGLRVLRVASLKVSAEVARLMCGNRPISISSVGNP